MDRCLKAVTVVRRTIKMIQIVKEIISQSNRCNRMVQHNELLNIVVV